MSFFSKVLVANRGEIALRIIRACKELKIPAIAIHSAADATALYVKKADESALVGPGPITGYLNIYRIIDLAKQMGADAIHPGYGFLAENAEFARECLANNITFIGPSSEAIGLMGNKVSARRLMSRAGIPIVPGIMDNLNSLKDAMDAAEAIGFPVMLKAAGGGGGRGLRICNDRSDLERFFNTTKVEAMASFGNDDIYMEKCIRSPHHIEFQILADHHGNIIHLGERDCSIQRRHQKLVEIAPSLFLDNDLRKKMGNIAVEAARIAGYTSAGTVEFLMDENKAFYFLEMNTRIQVEHTVTEEVTGLDIVKEMIRIAAGERLSISQQEVRIDGHAIECRINAEDPMRGFLPTPGKITAYYSPGGFGVRIDGNVYAGYQVPQYYDSLLAKLTVKGRTWDETCDRMYRCLDEYVIRGVKTTIPFYKRIMLDENFRQGKFDTNYIDERLEQLVYQDVRDPVDLVLAFSAAIIAHTRR